MNRQLGFLSHYVSIAKFRDYYSAFSGCIRPFLACARIHLGVGFRKNQLGLLIVSPNEKTVGGSWHQIEAYRFPRGSNGKCRNDISKEDVR
jgi:hypothetical protein